MSSREAASQKTAEVERVCGQQMQHAQADLHPDHTAHEMIGRDQRAIEEMHVPAGADERAREHQRSDAVDDRPGKGHRELAEALVSSVLALRIGVGEEAADGEQKDCAQAEVQISGHHQTRSLADHDSGDTKKEETQAARESGRPTEAEAHERKSRKEDVHAHLHASPSAKGNGPPTHTQNCSSYHPIDEELCRSPKKLKRAFGNPGRWGPRARDALAFLISLFAMRVIA